MRLNLHPVAGRSLFPQVATLLVFAATTFGVTGFAAAQSTEAKPGGGPTQPPPSEISKSPGVFQIKADSIHNLGHTGLNVTAAIVDTGIMANHPEFAGRVRPGYNAFDGSSNAIDGDGHGTHVSGIVGAAKNTAGMFGVAYNAYLLPIKVLNDRGSGTSASVANGIQYAVDQRKFHLGTATAAYAPFVMNLSLGSSAPSSTIATALSNAVTAGMVVAAAAGNDGGANPNYPARYAKEPWANRQIIVVGAVDANNRIASWSNRAGDTKDFYLVAPGVSIYSTYTKLDQKTKAYVDTYATLSGTSMATPYVTGAVALIKSGWPHLTAPTITSILFNSATDLGVNGPDGIDAVYGHGLLCLQCALDPNGQIIIPTSTGSASTVSGTSITTSSATGAALRRAGRAGLLQAAVFDSYGRDYQVDLSPAVRRAASTANSLAGMLSAVDSASEERRSQGGATFRIAYRSEASRLALGEQSGFGAGKDGYALAAMDAGGREMVFGLSGMGGNAFGLAGELARRGETHFGPQLANPYFSLTPQHTHAGVGFPISDGLRFKVGMLTSDPRIAIDGVPQLAERRQSMTLGEVSGQFESGVWTMGVGRLQESGSVLGTVQTGALGFSGNAGTTIANFGLAISPLARLKIGAQYTVGYTDRLGNGTDSLVTGYSAGRSEAYALFAALQEPFGRGDRLSITVSQPMRTVSGDMQLAVPVGADAQGAPVMQSRSISLRPDGREVRTDVLYMNPINRHANAFFGVTLRHQPDHDRTAPRQLTVGAGLRAVF